MPPLTTEIKMKIVISTDRQPFVNGRKAEKGEIFDVTAAEAKILKANGFAIDGESKPKRARNAKGHLKADDPKTPENEAWEGGVAPKKKKAKK